MRWRSAAADTLAQDDRQTISVLVGAASSMDFTARVIAEQLQSALGRTTIAVPRLGAGQRVALGEARRAAPDGRTPRSPPGSTREFELGAADLDAIDALIGLERELPGQQVRVQLGRPASRAWPATRSGPAWRDSRTPRFQVARS